MSMGTPITYMDPEEERKIEEREGHGLARTWDGWKKKVMTKLDAQPPGSMRCRTPSRRMK